MTKVESVLLRKVLETVNRGKVEAHTVSLDEMQFVVFVLPVSGGEAEGGRDEPGFDRPWKAVFIDWLRQGLTIEAAAEIAGVTRRHVYRCKRSDESFRREWDAVRGKGRR